MRRIEVMLHGSPLPARSFRLPAGLIFPALCFLLSVAQAQTGLKIQMVPESTAIVPGQSFRVGLFIQHEKGWHTYWRQPGIVGVPTTLEWRLPPGFTAGPLEYPEPEATKMFQIKAQGYERDVLLQAELRAPSSLKPGDRVVLKGQASWMCCANTCHPDTKELSLTMPVAAKAESDARWHPVFARERAAYALPSTAWEAEATEKDLEVTLTLRPRTPQARRFAPAGPAPKVLFFTEDGWINSDQDQTLRLNADGSLTIKLVRAEVFLGKGTPDRLHGVVQREGGWHEDGSLRSMTIQPLLRR